MLQREKKHRLRSVCIGEKRRARSRVELKNEIEIIFL